MNKNDEITEQNISKLQLITKNKLNRKPLNCVNYERVKNDIKNLYL